MIGRLAGSPLHVSEMCERAVDVSLNLLGHRVWGLEVVPEVFHVGAAVEDQELCPRLRAELVCLCQGSAGGGRGAFT